MVSVCVSRCSFNSEGMVTVKFDRSGAELVKVQSFLARWKANTKPTKSATSLVICRNACKVIYVNRFIPLVRSVPFRKSG